MLKIKKTGEGYYLASLITRDEELDRNDCYLAKKDLVPIIKSHREISFDMTGVKSIHPGGLSVLGDLLIMAKNKKCKIRFINAAPSISPSLVSLAEKTVESQSEMEIE